MKRYSWLCLLLLVAGEAAAAPEPNQVGTTFSTRQCQYLGVDPRETLKAILQNRLELIRFAAYWDEIEPREGAYDFSSLDWQIALAKAKHVPVVLTIGMKAPRWPEFFIPAWLMKDLTPRRGGNIAQDPRLRAATLKFLEAAVRRYREEDSIHYWQVENEPMDRVGDEFWWISPAFVRQEVELVRGLDPRHRPIVLTTVTYPNPWLRHFMYLFIRHDTIDESLTMGDILGVNVYPVVGHRWFMFKTSYYWTTPQERQAYLTSIMKRPKRGNKPVWVTELQAEPWEPGALVYTRPAPPPTGNPAIMQQAMDEMDLLGIHTVLLWGAEYWQFRKARYQDTHWWDAVRHLLQQKQPAWVY